MSNDQVSDPRTWQPPARGQYGRPKIKLPDGSGETLYTRVSTLAKTLSDQTGIMNWKAGMTALGVAQRPDLQALALSDPDPAGLRSLVKSALSAAGADSAANAGTALHAMSEHADNGYDLSTLPAQYRRDIEAYSKAMEPIDVIAMERFIVNDGLQAAGTFDRLVRYKGELVVADIKTGKSANKFALEPTIQIATYASGSLYNPENGDRISLPDYGVSQEVGLLIHLPKGQGECTLYELDLVAGMKAAKMCAEVRDMRKQIKAKDVQYL